MVNTGSARPLVVMVHGTRDEGASFAPVAAALGEFEVAYYDRRGWGADPDWDGVPATVEQHVDDFFAFLDGRTATVVGHSWGGIVALHAAVRHPDLLTSVGVYETAMTWLPGWPPIHREYIRTASDRAKEQRPGTPRQLRERALFAVEALTGLDAKFDVDRLTLPIVAAYGTGSIATYQVGIKAFAARTGAELVPFTDATHMAHRENVDEFAAFVRRVVAAGEAREAREARRDQAAPAAG